MTTQERRTTELSTANALLRKTLAEVCSYKTELEAEVATLRGDLLAARARETVLLQSLLDEVKRVSNEWLAQLKTIADDSVLSACAEILQKFKDGKNEEWNPDYWIRLAQGEDVEVAEEDPTALVDME